MTPGRIFRTTRIHSDIGRWSDAFVLLLYSAVPTVLLRPVPTCLCVVIGYPTATITAARAEWKWLQPIRKAQLQTNQTTHLSYNSSNICKPLSIHCYIANIFSVAVAYHQVVQLLIRSIQCTITRIKYTLTALIHIIIYLYC